MRSPVPHPPSSRLSRLCSTLATVVAAPFACAVALVATPVPVLAAAADDSLTRLLRQPDIHGDTVAFVYAGDIWTAGVDGGVARRLTSHMGMELFPRFSPDGKWIAFSGEYGGNRQVFVIGVDGGPLRQLTWYNDVGPMPPRGGWDYWVLDWTPDGRNVLFRGNRLPWSERMGRYYTVPVDGGLETPLAVPEGGSASLSPDGRRLAYTPIDREFRTWKRYRGGRNQDIWVYDLEKNTAEPVVESPAQDNQPIWIGDTIYFTSDRDRRHNLYALDLGSRAVRQVTRHDEYDVLWPAGDGRRIVYENGGQVWLFDPAGGSSKLVPIRVIGDFPAAAPVLRNVKDFIDRMDISPSGARALLTARGDVFTVPAKDGEIRPLTRSQGIRELDAAWSPDGRSVAYLSDRSGEYEIMIRPQDGSGEERRLTTDGDIWRFPPLWSPDSTRIAFADKKQRLRFVDVDGGRITEVDRGRYGDITEYTWSPDGLWLVYTKDGANRLSGLWAWSVEQKKAFPLTGELTGNSGAAFDPGGKYLYFLSNRDFNLTFSSWEFNYVYTGPTRIYVAALSADTPLPFAPKSDEEKPAGEKKDGDDRKDEAGGKEDEKKADAAGKEGGDKDKKPARPEPIRFDVAGFDNRVTALPAPAGTYRALAATREGPLYLAGDDGPLTLKFFNVGEEKEETILEGISAYVLSADGKKVLYRQGSDYGIVDAKPGQKNSDGRLKLDGLTMTIDPRAEWAQIYQDGWRILRDWFYDPGMHGLDWAKLRERYGRLVPHVAHRAALDYIFGELGGELNSGHVYVNWGDFPRPARIEGGLLGAELAADPSGFYRITKIFPGENWHPDFRSPLTEAGVKAKVGELILAIDGQPVSTRDNPYRFLAGKGGRVVTLTLGDRPGREGAHDEKVRPVTQETNLRYLDWVLERRRRVEEASGGRIGYIHLPNTAVEGNRELFKYFYPQVNKDALILDARYNGGGFIPDRMIELLDRPRLNYWVQRGVEPNPTPGFGHDGPKACLINGYSSSGGDAFPYYFRKRGLGPLIGTRTWGGLIGISGNPGFVDDGSINVPTFRFLDTDGKWAVEGEGVSPDIEVVDRPDEVVRGRDPALEKAIEVLLEQLKKTPPRPVKVPAPFVDRP